MTIQAKNSIIICMGTGIIVINPYQIPAESVHQAKRIQQEFLSLGVSVEIVTDTFLQNQICENTIKSTLKGVEFAVYLDKDKYQSEILESFGLSSNKRTVLFFAGGELGLGKTYTFNIFKSFCLSLIFHTIPFSIKITIYKLFFLLLSFSF